MRYFLKQFNHDYNLPCRGENLVNGEAYFFFFFFLVYKRLIKIIYLGIPW